MKISIVVGGQFGSEGKGKAALYLAKKRKADVAIRIGGANSGHTVFVNGKKEILYHLPSAAFEENVLCVIGPGSYINPERLYNDIKKTKLTKHRLVIDRNAFIINESDSALEKHLFRLDNIASTLSGTGQALMRRIARNKQNDLLESFICNYADIRNSSELLYHAYHNSRVIIEGTQGYGLSVLHSDYYPYVTSRDTTAAGFLSEAGLSPIDVDEILMVIRSFPIRVSGNSGPLKDEITWKDVTEISGYGFVEEYTSVTNRLRRVGIFDHVLVNSAIKVNKPTSILLNHVDYFDSKCNKGNFLTHKAIENIHEINYKLLKKINLVGVGFGVENIIEI